MEKEGSEADVIDSMLTATDKIEDFLKDKIGPTSSWVME